MNIESGSVDMNSCPSKLMGRKNCRCGKCAICGFSKHSAIHGPVNDGKPGSKPYGHEFEEKFDHVGCLCKPNKVELISENVVVDGHKAIRTP